MDNIELPKARRIFLSDMKRIGGNLSLRTGYAPKGTWLSENGYHEEARRSNATREFIFPNRDNVTGQLLHSDGSVGNAL